MIPHATQCNQKLKTNKIKHTHWEKTVAGIERAPQSKSSERYLVVNEQLIIVASFINMTEHFKL